jgi:hypothetical protein
MQGVYGPWGGKLAGSEAFFNAAASEANISGQRLPISAPAVAGTATPTGSLSLSDASGTEIRHSQGQSQGQAAAAAAAQPVLGLSGHLGAMDSVYHLATALSSASLVSNASMLSPTAALPGSVSTLNTPAVKDRSGLPVTAAPSANTMIVSYHGSFGSSTASQLFG